MITKCVASHARNGRSVSQPTSTSHTPAMAADTAFLAVSSQPVWLTNAAAKAANAVLTSSTRMGATSRLKCG